MLSLYNASIPILDRFMANLDHILRKGEADAKARDIDPSIFLNARLAPDMAHLIRQVQIATSLAKNCPHRVVGSTPPVYEDTEQTFAELYALIAKTRAELATFSPDDLNGLEGKALTVPAGPNTMDFIGIAYVSSFILPNIFFHVTTAYNILRHNGVPLGKLDYFGGTAR